MSHHAEPSTLFYRYTDGGALEKVAQPTQGLPIPMSSQSPLRLSSWHIPSESGSVPNAPSAASNPEHIGYASIGYDYPCHSDYPHGWAFSVPVHRYDARPCVLEHAIDLPPTPPQFISGPRGELDQLFPRIRTYEVIYTDDARMKLGDGIRRQCFNCRATETTTWRRSMLSPGKLLCNKCGLFERTHGIPRPKTFPRRRRSRPASVHSNMDIQPFDGGVTHPHYQNHHSPTMPVTTHPFNTFDAVGGETISQETSWMTYNTTDTASTPARVGACYPATQLSTMYRPDSHLLSTIPTESACTASSW